MLRTLKALANANVEARNAQLGTSARRFEYVDHGHQGFSIRVKGGTDHGVVFVLDNGRFSVRHGTATFYVLPTLDKHGACKCKVGAEELDPWQVLKKALEPLLFE